MAGIYVHIPFCRIKCSYCNFHFSTNHSLKDRFLEALDTEFLLRSQEVSQPINSIYFGGGTPSLLSVNELESLLNRINTNYAVNSQSELTIEVNPEDISKEYLKNVFQLGFNRLSIGIQSFNDSDLNYMNRAHDAKQALKALELVKNSDFKNYTLDLIYGSPTTTNQILENNIETALQFMPTHISAYALTVEEKTQLHYNIRTGKEKPISEEHQQKQFEILVNHLINNNFLHYEISNFALEGFRAKHNSSYWKGEAYLGFGPSAHSYLNNFRQWNVSNNALYIRGIEEGKPNFEQEILSEKDQINERIMTSLRTLEGVDLEELQNNYSTELVEKVLQEMKKLLKENLLTKANKQIKIPKEKRFFADGIAAELFIVD